MRLRLLRVLPILLAALIASACFVAPARAGEKDTARREKGAHDQKVVRGLQAGIKSLRAIGGQERMIAHLQELIVELKRSGRGKAPKGGDAEKRRMGEMVEVMWMAHQALRKAERTEQAEVLEHGVHALKMLWSGRSDEEAMAILATAPSRTVQAHALFQAAEILGDQGQKRLAKRCAVLGRKLQGKQEARGANRQKGRAKSKAKAKNKEKRKEKRGHGEVRAVPADAEHGLAGLRQRMAVLRLAMKALREGEQREAVEALERALHTGELLLEERQDEEAQQIYRNTPGLVELAKLLHLSARFWLKFERPEKAERVAHLSRYYRQRAAQEQEGEAEAAGRETERARGLEGARRARAKTWAVRQQRELEARERRARDEEVLEQRRREHEGRMRAHVRRGAAPGRRERGHASAAEQETSRRIEELRSELHEVQRALKELMRELRDVVRDR